jgi:hypothetical protein
MTKFVKAHIVQGNYGDGWEDLYAGSTPDTKGRKEARENLKDYRLNSPGNYRLIGRRVLRTNFETGNF